MITEHTTDSGFGMPMKGIRMRRVAPLIALALALAACAGDTADPIAETTTAVTETTEAPSTTTTTTEPAQALDTPFETTAFTPPDVFETYVSELTMTIEMGDGQLEISGAGSWVGDAFECEVRMEIEGFGFTQAVVATPDTLWFDDGTSGYVESTMNRATETVVASCPASPLFWENFVSAGTRPIGETEQYAGRPAIKVDLRSAIEIGSGLSVIPDVNEAIINQMDMWVDAETNVVLGIYADLEVAPGALGELGLPGEETSDNIAVTMDLQTDRINDQSVSVTIPNA